jgi:DNA polymerase III subunit beta
MAMFTCELKPLVDALKAAKKLVPTKNPIPVLGYALVQAGELSVTDLGQELSLDLPSADNPTPFLLPVHDALKLFSGANAGALVQITQDNGLLHIVVGDLEADLETLPPEDMPEFSKPIGALRPVLMSDSDFVQIFSATAGCMSKEETRYYLRGINFCSEHGKLAVVSTSGHMLAHALTQADFSGDPVILPDVTTRLALGLPRGAVALSIYDNQVSIRGEGWSLRAKAVNGTFPDYTRIIPKTAQGSLTMPTKTLKDAVTRIHKLTGGDVAAVLDKDAQKLTAQGSASFKALAIALPMDVQGDAITQGYNPGYLVDMVKLVELFDDTITIHTGAMGDPARIVPDCQPDFGAVQFVLMPRRH